MAYLNEKSGKAFKPTSKSTQALINARLGEGYTVDDFKHVIDKKVAEWKGNDRMEPYLRPETLFGCKFKNYMKQEGVSESDTDYPFIIDLNGLF